MLKIKRERLDELEKFGFKKMHEPEFDLYFKSVDFCVDLCVNNTSCRLWMEDYGHIHIPNVIYDLIEAGMVEKGDDDE